MKLQLICLCILLGLSSCGSHRLHKKLEEFIRKEVVVPDGIRQMINGQDTIVLNPALGIARIVVWANSVACTSCRLNMMSQYGDMINYQKDAEGGFAILFVFSPPQEKIYEVIETLKILRFDYPILLDDSGLFPASNPHIPVDNRFHTFLLDKNGKVVLVGDPVNNPPLWELYKTTITTLIENGGVMPTVEN